MLSTVFGTLTIWKPRKLLLYHKHENKDNFCIKTKTMWNISLFPSFVCWYFLGCIAYKCFFPAASNTQMRCFQKSIIIVQMFIDHKLVAAHAPMTFDWLVGLLVANPRENALFRFPTKWWRLQMTIQGSAQSKVHRAILTFQMVKSTSFEGMILRQIFFVALLEHLNLIGSSTLGVPEF